MGAGGGRTAQRLGQALPYRVEPHHNATSGFTLGRKQAVGKIMWHMFLLY